VVISALLIIKSRVRPRVKTSRILEEGPWDVLVLQKCKSSSLVGSCFILTSDDCSFVHLILVAVAYYERRIQGTLSTPREDYSRSENNVSQDEDERLLSDEEQSSSR
jgi:hypothetical protein